VNGSQAARESLQGNYSGAVSRLAAYVIDVSLSSALFTLGLAATGYVVSIVIGRSFTWNHEGIAASIAFVVWEFLYFAYSWATTGKTIGMALLGVRVVRADGAAAGPRRAVVRTLALPLSIILFGLGFIGILIQREHRALHDLIAGTAVVYAWDARAARLRLLAARAGKARRGGPAAATQPSAAGDAAGEPQAES
jgi:uncharacterized RDD family membrane protein YckC